MRQYGMNFDEALRKRKDGDLSESYENELLPAFVADMGQQIDRSLQFFFAASAKHSAVDQVILAGGCAHIPHVSEAIEERLRIPCVIARPFLDMGLSARAARPGTLAREEASLLIAAGLAWRSFDPPR